ncbi:MAG: tRNA threonylcarbamoyladenosine dehydratase [Lachnospiraceae bacterium]
MDQYSRLKLIMGQEAVDKIASSRVAVFGLGGVGGSAVEALARCGVGTLDIIDNDKVSITNLNRQILATHETIGRYKTDVAEERIHSIDPDITVNKYCTFYLPDGDTCFDFGAWDYVVDAIDTVTGKIGIIIEARKAGTPVISCMGCGNRLDPTKLVAGDIYETENDPLSRVMRRELRKRGVRSLKVVYSTEIPVPCVFSGDESSIHDTRKTPPGSTSFVPPAAGAILASVVIRDITGRNDNR